VVSYSYFFAVLFICHNLIYYTLRKSVFGHLFGSDEKKFLVIVVVIVVVIVEN